MRGVQTRAANERLDVRVNFSDSLLESVGDVEGNIEGDDTDVLVGGKLLGTDVALELGDDLVDLDEDTGFVSVDADDTVAVRVGGRRDFGEVDSAGGGAVDDEFV